ncbi:uncharacterized protein LOC115623226 [Scaptodrosophila lebanonensis]|uniref:Uncharacterized protein LOC115623226 n=1 Tax=Drosophila lebanonensis TaxID=7225 RepID=A0A6J2TBC1_DROLE|nr:uncharacterized protein LOC115623226 [Scaptodrosophila lebanonensis]XP_030373329.1 uncharacterized protein LOC115623226 [Scaptodrosophila lebanonensis]XP_030373330.1 uncharacterized protein LOC115623226 [Scaptodrosophila lebanonensis]XP_030373331.1 uncharacterized protein LOC115623226 [Scaptodrosophila lebanonensis]XP_030373332.1 uncharacterized protein LOC115623226 [Scaptodrosophila lebanonensis]XP_030373333.1 uncharacterized protein LOC115623226 [Scaptodrosophila lebanonensis]
MSEQNELPTGEVNFDCRLESEQKFNALDVKPLQKPVNNITFDCPDPILTPFVNKPVEVKQSTNVGEFNEFSCSSQAPTIEAELDLTQAKIRLDTLTPGAALDLMPEKLNFDELFGFESAAVDTTPVAEKRRMVHEVNIVEEELPKVETIFASEIEESGGGDAVCGPAEKSHFLPNVELEGCKVKDDELIANEAKEVSKRDAIEASQVQLKPNIADPKPILRRPLSLFSTFFTAKALIQPSMRQSFGDKVHRDSATDCRSSSSLSSLNAPVHPALAFRSASQSSTAPRKIYGVTQKCIGMSAKSPATNGAFRLVNKRAPGTAVLIPHPILHILKTKPLSTLMVQPPAEKESLELKEISDSEIDGEHKEISASIKCARDMQEPKQKNTRATEVFTCANSKENPLHKKDVTVPEHKNGQKTKKLRNVNLKEEINPSPKEAKNSELRNVKKRSAKLSGRISAHEIVENGELIFEKFSKLYFFNNYKEWIKRGEGKTQIWQMAASNRYFVLMWDLKSGELLLHTELHDTFKLEFKGDNSSSCICAEQNFAKSPNGILERLACRFQKHETAVDFLKTVKGCLATRSELN